MNEKQAEMLRLLSKNSFQNITQKASRNIDLSFEKYLVLNEIRKAKRAKGSQIAGKLGVSRAAISKRSFELLESGLIEENQTHEDRWVHYLTLTPKGKQALRELDTEYTNLMDEVNQVMGETEWQTLMRIFHDFKLSIQNVQAVSID